MQKRANPVDVPEAATAALLRRAAPQQLAAVAALRAEIETLTDDPEVVRDTLAGAVDLETLFDFLLADIAHTQALCGALKEQAEKVAKRMQRLQRRAETARQLIRRGLELAALPGDRCERPLATISLSRKAPALGPLDEALIPIHYWVPQPVKLDRAGLLDALKDGLAVPGATLEPPCKVLHIKGD